MATAKENLTLSLIWKRCAGHSFNCISIGKVTRDGGLCLLVAGEDAVARLFDMPTTTSTIQSATANSSSTNGASPKGDDNKLIKLIEKRCLETKGGPIQQCEIADVTRLHVNDILVSDSRGTVTVFCNQQILLRKVVSSHSIDCLQVQQDPTGAITIATGDSQGHITAFNTYTDHLWRVRLADIRHAKGLGVTPTTRCVLAVELPNSHSSMTHYILVSDNTKRLYVIHEGTVVVVLNTPAVVTAMCVGHFADLQPDPGDTTTPPGGVKNLSFLLQTQVALACDTGAIYIMSNYQIYQDEFTNVYLPIHHMRTLHSGEHKGMDVILCAGDFSKLCAIRDGEEVGMYLTSMWINSINLADIDGDGQQEIVVGCLDNSIHALKPTWT